MYKIVRKTSGYVLTFGGVIGAGEMKQWYRDSEKALAKENGSFGVIVDMRTLAPLLGDAQKIMVEGQTLYRKAGMVRSAVILSKAFTTAQFKRLAKLSGIHEWERYIDATATDNWKDLAIDWVKHGIDPDRA